jgi:hypothetical protein
MPSFFEFQTPEKFLGVSEIYPFNNGLVQILELGSPTLLWLEVGVLFGEPMGPISERMR